MPRCRWRAEALAVASALLLTGCEDEKRPVPDPHPANALRDIEAREEVNESANVRIPFDTRRCVEQDFPGDEAPGPPPQVQFFCAAAWNRDSFAAVRRALDDAGVDLTILIERMAPESRSRQGLYLEPIDVAEADAGPPGFGTAYRIYYLLPYLILIRNGSQVMTGVHPQDLAALRRAEEAVDWHMPALEEGYQPPQDPRMYPEATLSDVLGVIQTVTHYYRRWGFPPSEIANSA